MPVRHAHRNRSDRLLPALLVDSFDDQPRGAPASHLLANAGQRNVTDEDLPPQARTTQDSDLHLIVDCVTMERH